MLAQLLRRLLGGWLIDTFLPDDLFDTDLDEAD